MLDSLVIIEDGAELIVCWWVALAYFCLGVKVAFIGRMYCRNYWVSG